MEQGTDLLLECTVYDISILSNVPLSVNDLVSSSSPPSRLRPLFTIGVHDIPYLEEEAKPSAAYVSTSPDEEEENMDERGQGWVAFTTDGVLATKGHLFDVLVTLPPPNHEEATEKIWPRMESPQGTELRATQRDARRYDILRRGLTRAGVDGAADNDDEAVDDDQAQLLPKRREKGEEESSSNYDDTLVEPMSWPAMAYSSYLWWASAGERRSDRQEEIEGDEALLCGLENSETMTISHNSYRRRSTGDGLQRMVSAQMAAEMVLIAYFHRLTTLMLSTMADVVESSEEADDDDETEGKTLFVASDDMMRMGLDVWSKRDQRFVEELVRSYFDREAEVQGGQIDCCGVRIC